MTALNYATQYSQALAQAYPYVLYFAALFQTENDDRYRWLNSNTIEIPSITTTGRVDSDRDTITMATRNYANAWEPKKLTNHRKWSTLVHPRDIIETNHVASIQNITKAYNEEKKFPEMDAYLISKLYADWKAQSMTPIELALTTENVLTAFDTMYQAMTEKRVPQNGRYCYILPAVDTLLKNAAGLYRTLNVGVSSEVIKRAISNIDNVQFVTVPSELMKTLYNFTEGYKPEENARQISMFMVHPSAVITPIAYEFARLDPPHALSEGKYVYFEESDEDVFILNNRKDALQFVVAPAAGVGG
jgi:hypothetical protein|nr:MAG TPA: major capsid protein [Caudoviricetes sp.]